MILCLDPGKKVAGVSLWEDKELTTAWLARGNTWAETADNVIEKIPVSAVLIRTIVIERMQIRKDSKRPADLVELLLMSGRVTGRLPRCRIVEYEPHNWKGGTPKKIMTERILSKLSKDERDRIEKPKAMSLFHNTVDAVGIGVRFTRGPHALGK